MRRRDARFPCRFTGVTVPAKTGGQTVKAFDLSALAMLSH